MRYLKYLGPVVPLLMVLGLIEVLADLKMFRPPKLRGIAKATPSDTLPEIKASVPAKKLAPVPVQVAVNTMISNPQKAQLPELAPKTITKGPFNPNETYNLRPYAAFNTGVNLGLTAFMDQSAISGQMVVEGGKITQFDVSMGADSANVTINFSDIEINNNLSYIQDPDDETEGAEAGKGNSTLLFTAAQDANFSIFTVSFIAGKYNGIKLQFVKDKDFLAFDELVRERNERFKDQGPALIKKGSTIVKSPIKAQNLDENDMEIEAHEHEEDKDLSSRLRNLSSQQAQPPAPAQRAIIKNAGSAF